MAEHKVLTLSQVAQHKTKKDCWVVVHGRVLNVTKFLEEHPGGEEVLIEVAGKDATKDFDNIGHSKAAHNMLINYQVGVLQGYSFQDSDTKAAASTNGYAKDGEMSAFVIKEAPSQKFSTFLEFFVPLAVASFFFGYRYLTRAAAITY